MDNKKLLIGILLFGSLWGFIEVILGSTVAGAGYHSGGLMTGFFAIPLLVLSRMIFRQPGMQLGMGAIAGGLRLFNPFMGCHVCSAIAIMAEAAIFEFIFYSLSNDFRERKTLTMQSSIGILSAYTLFVSGYIITQILTPIVAGSGFFIENLLVIVPKILAAGILPALIAAFTAPLIYAATKLDITIKDKIYYPAAISTSIFCWVAVIGSWLIYAV